MNYLKIIINL